MEKDISFYIDQYLNYLRVEKRLAQNSISSYSSDLVHFSDFLFIHDLEDPLKITRNDIVNYIEEINKSGISKSSLARKVISLRNFFKFLIIENVIKTNPLSNIDVPKPSKKLPDVISIQEISDLLEKPDLKIPMGVRDRAILEVLYGSGLRASELISLKMESVNLTVGYVQATGKGSKQRIVPLGEQGLKYIKQYIKDARLKILKGKLSEFLFITRFARPMTRQ
jgi:integrase/recombinase XerD